MNIELDKSGPGSLNNSTVTGQWSGAYGGIVSGETDDDGEIEFETPGILSAESITFTVLNISNPRFTYDPSQNVATSITIPSPI